MALSKTTILNLVAGAVALLGACINPDAGHAPTPVAATSMPDQSGSDRAKRAVLRSEPDSKVDVEPPCVTPKGDDGGVAASATVDWATLDAGTEAPHMVRNAASVVAGMRHGFKACYMDQLSRDQDAAGTVRAKVLVGCDGFVVSVYANTADGIDKATVDCMLDIIRGVRFAPPAGGHAVIAIPVTFVKH